MKSAFRSLATRLPQSLRGHWPLTTLLLAIVFLLTAIPTAAQLQSGTPPFGSFGGSPDVVNLANLNSQITIPVRQKPGRGIPFNYNINYNSSVWYPVGASGSQTWKPVTNWGWSGQTDPALGYLTYSMSSSFCYSIDHGQRIPTGTTSFESGYIYHDFFGTAHGFAGTTEQQSGTCGSTETSLNATARDGSGLVLNVPIGALTTITTPSGYVIYPASTNTGTASGTDRNGNQLSAASGGVFTDTLGTTALTVAGSGTATSPMTFTYTAPSGAAVSYTMNFTNYTVATNFGVSGISDYKSTAAVPLVSSIVLPDGSQYTFRYEATPSTPSVGACTPYSGTTCVTARLTSVTLPTGGTISYAYSGGNNGILLDGSSATLTRTTPDGTWTYAQVKNSGAASTTTITDPQNNVTVLQFQGIYETQRQTYQGSTSGTLLQTVNTCYNAAASPCTGTAITLPIAQRTAIDQYGSNGLQCKHNYFYNSVGGLTEQDDYDYGSGAPGALLRKTLVTFASLGNITAFRRQVAVQNGSGTTFAQTNYNYDEVTPTATSGIAQHTSVSGSRGNLTSINYPVSGLTSHFTYYDTGSPSTSQDINGATTTYNYSSNTASCQMAFPTSVSEPLSMSKSFAWNCAGGAQTSITDENNQTTTITWNDPYFWRPGQTNFPDGGQTSVAYNSQTSVTTTVKMNASQNIVGTALLDGLGRTKQQQLNSDPQGVDFVDTAYDALGRVATASNPYRSTSDPTYGLTTVQYDALNRPALIIPPDGTSSSNNVAISYTNNCVTSTDQAGKSRKSCADALGRVTQVFEDPAGLNYETDYTYDVLGDLTAVTQNGSRQRTYVYDALSRLTSETNPESGTITYGYDASGHTGDVTSKVAPAPNQTGSATVTTTYTWDQLHRLTEKSYSNGAAPNQYYYDGANRGSSLGRLTHASNNVNAAYDPTYDALGRVTSQVYCIPSDCSYGVKVSATYDLAGNLTSLTYPSGRVLKNAFDGAGRPTQVTFDNFAGTAVGYNYLSSASYAANSAPASITLGNGLTETTTYNKMFQLNNQQVSSSVLTPLYRSFSFYDANGHNNGNVASVIDNLAPGRTQSFGYDSLDRIVSAGAAATSGADCWAQNFGYDAWGNLLSTNPTRAGCPMNSLSVGVDTNNHITNTGFSYDAAGNLLADGTNTYVLDAENHVTSINSGAAAYTYGPDGTRARKQVGSDSTDYVYFGGNVLAEKKPNGDWSDYIYVNGRRLAKADNFDQRIHIFGSTPAGAGAQYEIYDFSPAASYNGYVVQSGDKLFTSQFQSAAACGGIDIFFSDGTRLGFVISDQDGYFSNEDQTHNLWHYRRFDLTSYAGKTISQAAVLLEGCTAAGNSWDIYFEDIALVSIDGTTRPIYNGQSSVSLSMNGSSGIVNPAYEVNHSATLGDQTNATNTTRYYHSDLLGSARMLSAGGGWPISSSTYLPFGQEWNPQISVNHYKFTGDEHDSESALDHTQFRQYASSLGRWTAPDPAGLAAVDPSAPQSWNRYAYVGNNPPSFVDPLGLFLVFTGSDEGGGGGGGVDPCFFFGLFCGGGSPTPPITPPGGGRGGGGKPPCLKGVGPLAPGQSYCTKMAVGCGTVLPNGQTVGDVVQQQRAALRNGMIPGTNIDNWPTINRVSTFASVAAPGGPIDFKNNFQGQANPNVLASAGNFAYYAIGSGNLSTFALDTGAGAYGLFTATFGSRPFSDLTGPMFSDSSAAAVRNAALASNGCSQ